MQIRLNVSDGRKWMIIPRWLSYDKYRTTNNSWYVDHDIYVVKQGIESCAKRKKNHLIDELVFIHEWKYKTNEKYYSVLFDCQPEQVGISF